MQQACVLSLLLILPVHCSMFAFGFLLPGPRVYNVNPLTHTKTIVLIR